MSMASALTKLGLLFWLQNHPIQITWAKAAPQPHWDLFVSSEVKYSNQQKGWISWKKLGLFSPARLQGFAMGLHEDAHHAIQKVRPGTALHPKASHSVSSCMLGDHFCSYKIPLGQREDFRTCASRDASQSPTSTARWHLTSKDEFERIPKNYRGKCTAAAKYHFTQSESNYFL